MSRAGWVVLVGISVLVAGIRQAAAVSLPGANQCVVFKDPADTFAAASAVFVGVVETTKPTGIDGFHVPQQIATFRVDEQWKGRGAMALEVATTDLPFERDASYVVFAGGEPLQTNLRCGWAVRREQAGELLNWLATRNTVESVRKLDSRRLLEDGLPGTLRVRNTAPGVVPPEVAGEWRVIAIHPFGTSGRSAIPWIGRSATYSATFAGFAQEPCTAPRFRVLTVDSDDFFVIGFRASPLDVNLKSGPLTVVEVVCHLKGWTAIGSMLIVRPDGRLWTHWDGVFFEMSR